MIFKALLACALILGLSAVSFDVAAATKQCGPKCRAAKAKAAKAAASKKRKAPYCNTRCQDAKGMSGSTEAAYCGPKCKAAKAKNKNPGKLKVGKNKKGKGKGRSYACPQGTNHVPRYCPKLEPTIKKVLGGNVKCWSNLFGVEGGCSHTVNHDPKKAHNPHAGIGLCAIETSPAIRKQNKRGPACANIKGIENQMRCCKSMMQKTNGRYFGTVGCGNVGKCS